MSKTAYGEPAMEAIWFLVGMSVGGLAMLLIILRIIANMPDRFGRKGGRR